LIMQEDEHIENWQNTVDSLKICVVIPAYNNCGTIVEVVRSVLVYCQNVIVVCDGSTDGTDQVLCDASLPVQVIAYEPNRGKGVALSQGFRAALSQGFRYAITLDADGQHRADDLPAMVGQIAAEPGALVLGCRGLRHDNMPLKNTFANRCSNFWFTVQTGLRLPDTQTGYRCYPLFRMGKMRLLTTRYEAELEMLVRCVWRNIPVKSVPIQVYYPPSDKRVSFFRPVRDFMRIGLLNALFCIVAVLYGYPSMLLRKVCARKRRTEC
jgi:glycosyltransferase involved in cell wall biosynthesis